MLGIGHSLMALILLGSTSNPLAEMTNPKNTVVVVMKEHFFKVNNQRFTNKWLKYLVHEMHECARGIREAKRHD